MKRFLVSLALVSVAFVANAKTDPASQANAEPPVKKSSSGICHEKGSSNYSQTKKFTSFNSMDECLKSGGRAPKEGAVKKSQESKAAPDTKKSPATK